MKNLLCLNYIPQWGGGMAGNISYLWNTIHNERAWPETPLFKLYSTMGIMNETPPLSELHSTIGDHDREHLLCLDYISQWESMTGTTSSV